MKKFLPLVLLLALTYENMFAQTVWGTQIGTTWYDLQSNAASGNRLYRHTDGTLSATWTMSCTQGATAWPNRGTGYSYFNGTSWTSAGTPSGTCPSTFGITSVRSGWPEVLGFPNGSEMVITHTPLAKTTRATKGTGSWSATQDLVSGITMANTWPRAVNVGNTIHMIASCLPCTSATGVTSPIRYFRSQNAGASWDIVDADLPGQDLSSFQTIGGDNYAIHANGNTVAIIAGGFDNDWVLWKSTNNGTSWTKKIIRKFATADVYYTAGTPYYQSNDRYHAILVDHNGIAHAWAGLVVMEVDPFTLQQTGSYYPALSEGLWYWNDGALNACPKPQIIVAEHENIYPAGHPLNFIGNGTYVTPARANPYTGSYISMPSAALAPNGDIYLVYSAVVEGTSNTFDQSGQSFRDLYVMRGTNGGMTWSMPKNISNEIANVGRTNFDEEVFPSVAKMIGTDNRLHMIFQSDGEPGLHVQGDLDLPSLNKIVYYSFDVTNYSWPVTTTLLACGVANDVGVVSINSPVSGCSLSANSSVCITVQNFGTSTQSNVPVSYTLNGGPVNSGIIAGPIVPGGQASFCFSQTANLSAPGNYSITANTALPGDANASNNSFAATVVSSAPFTPIAGANQTVCSNEPAFQLTGFSPAGGTWSGNGVSASGLFAPSASLVGTQTLTYSVTVNGCTGTSTKEITVTAAPAVSAGSNQIVCASAAPFNLSGFSPAGGTWSGNGVSAGGTFTPSQSLAGNNTLTYTVTANGCTNTATKTVTVTTGPAVNAGTGNNVCADAPPFLLSGFSPAGGTWSGNGVSPNGTFTPATNLIGSNALTYSVTDANGCTGSATTTVNVDVAPVAGFTYSINGNSVTFINSSSGASTYSWNFGDGNTSAQLNPTHTYSGNGNYTVSLTAIPSIVVGCSTTATQNIFLTATPDLFDKSIRIYPNPTHGILIIDRSDENTGPLLVEIFSTQGQLVKRTMLNAQQANLDLAGYAEGIYHVKITSTKAVIHRKIVLSK